MLIVSETVDHAIALLEMRQEMRLEVRPIQLLYEFTWFAAHIFLPSTLRYLTATKTNQETVVESLVTKIDAETKTEQLRKKVESARKGFLLLTLMAILAGYLFVA